MMSQKYNYPKWMFILFPALAMMLGWGLRGYIGGGPYGAMIPGAMVVLCIGMLLNLSAEVTSVLIVFGVIGIGLGGEMTYGQTLGFLRNPETVWWGTAGTTLKGSIWGLLGGIVLSIGFFFKTIPKKTTIIAFLLMITGVLLGFKLINDPMILYFSDPTNPRAESWAGLLFGAVAILIFLKFNLDRNNFTVITRFALRGMIGGGLGFGLGGFWLVLGSRFPDVIFNNWWKAMEFSFGFLLGASLGYAAWLSRKESFLIGLRTENNSVLKDAPVWTELGVISATGLLIFWLIPNSIEWFTETSIINNMPGGTIKQEIARLFDGYFVTGLIFVLVLYHFPKMGWQIGITLAFCHTAIDLVRDFYPETNYWSPFTMHFFWVLPSTAVVALLTLYFSRRQNRIRNMFLLIICSCVAVAFLRSGTHIGLKEIQNLSVCEVICGRFFVDFFFLFLAATVSGIALKWFKKEK